MLNINQEIEKQSAFVKRAIQNAYKDLSEEQKLYFDNAHHVFGEKKLYSRQVDITRTQENLYARFSWALANDE